MDKFIFHFCKVVIILILTLVFNCNQIAKNQKVEKGVLNLEFWDNKSIIELTGEWEFYWKQFIENSDSIEGREYISVPNVWNGKKISNEIIQSYGYATYILRIKGIKTKETLSIRFRDQGSEFQIFANDRLILGDGIPTENVSGRIPRYIPFSRKIGVAENEEMVIRIHISNHIHSKGGMWYPIYFGTEDSINEYVSRNRNRDFFLVGCIFIIGIYHFIIYLNGRKLNSSLLFSFICISTSFRTLVTNDRFVFECIDLNGIWLYKIEYICFYILPILYAFFVYFIFPVEYKKKFAYSYLVFYGLQILFVLVFPLHIFTLGLFYIQIVTLVGMLHGLYCLIIANKNNREGSGTFLLGFLILFTCFANDILHGTGVIYTMYVLPVGIVIFILFQSWILSKKYESYYKQAELNYKEVKRSHRELEELKDELEVKVAIRNAELHQTITNIHKDLVIAQEIQNKILPERKDESKLFKYYAKYIPMEKVGGDYFDIVKIKEDYIRFFLADATGHGIQAAMITMLIKSEYEGLKLFIQRPEMLLELLNREIHHKYQDLKIYFSCAILDIDFKNKKIIYASAGHPDQLIYKSGSIVPLSSKGKLIGLVSNQEINPVEINVESNDKIFLFTDGVFEEFDSLREQFGEERLKRFLEENVALDCEELSNNYFQELKKFLGDRHLQDDITFIIIEIK
ncbi:MAG: SpoIIE family protein phosphatase [Leptospiraceae bacterium]|nr:SpoIIE family protein phosphatase [Leptospiraceae bacterium]